MKIRKFKKRYWITAICVILFYYLLAFGPLFPWNPIKSGYEELKAQTYSVYYQKDTELPAYYQNLESYLSETSITFNLPRTRYIKLIRTDKSHMKGYIPWLNTDSLGGVALQTGDILYINSEKIAEQKLNEEEYIKHELVHLLLHQNTNIINASRATKVTYVSEGIPFYLSGPSFYSQKEFLECLKKVKLQETTEGDEIYTADSFSGLDEQSAERYKVSHMLYGGFIGYLIKTYGQEKFNIFDHEFLNTPSLHRQLFEEVYEKKLEVVLQEFEESLQK